MATSLTPTNTTLTSVELLEALSLGLLVYMEAGSWATTTMEWDHSRVLERGLTLSLKDRQGMGFPSSSSSSSGLVTCLTSNIMGPPVVAMLSLLPAFPWTSHLTAHHPSMAFPLLHHQSLTA